MVPYDGWTIHVFQWVVGICGLIDAVAAILSTTKAAASKIAHAAASAALLETAANAAVTSNVDVRRGRRLCC